MSYKIRDGIPNKGWVIKQNPPTEVITVRPVTPKQLRLSESELINIEIFGYTNDARARWYFDFSNRLWTDEVMQNPNSMIPNIVTKIKEYYLKTFIDKL